MNILPLIEAVRSIDSAALATVEPNEREIIKNCGERLRNVLQCRGVFVGRSENVENVAALTMAKSSIIGPLGQSR